MNINHVILTAGPSISALEIEYATDAAANGWNNQWAEYLRRFEKTMADFIGVRQALATASCTGAMHLGLLGLGIGPGDEVIIPEITWVATASAVIYTGATPVFCDVEPDTWCISPASFEKAITPRTKAVMPVHLYGHPCDMTPILQLAEKHNLFVVEDAAQSIGAEYQGKRTGSFGNLAAVSFQGAKAFVTGEGGMLLTSDDELMDRIAVIGDHGRSRDIALFNTSIGYKYKMSNIQAALGLAQIERAEEILTKKRQIFQWYRDRLVDVDAITLNAERPECKNIFWMSSLVLQDEKADRQAFMAQLKEQGIDSRPIFYPLSSMPMFNKADNPVAYHVGLKGINLPSGHNRTEEEIDYICSVIRKLVGAGPSSKVGARQPWGWLKREKEIQAELASAKKEKLVLPFTLSDGRSGELVSVTDASITNMREVELLARWRRENQHAFFDRLGVTEEGTRRWLQNMQEKVRDRILFFFGDGKKYVGHIGLFRFDCHTEYAELDNLILGDRSGVDYAGPACVRIMEWARDELGLKGVHARILASNKPALLFNNMLGMREINRTPLRSIQVKGGTSLRPLYIPGYNAADDYVVTMKLSFNEETA